MTPDEVEKRDATDDAELQPLMTRSEAEAAWARFQMAIVRDAPALAEELWGDKR